VQRLEAGHDICCAALHGADAAVGQKLDDFVCGADAAVAQHGICMHHHIIHCFVSMQMLLSPSVAFVRTIPKSTALF
jgi:hypothetical protein